MFRARIERTLGRVGRGLVLLAAVALLGTSCTVRYIYLKPDYERNEKDRVKRIVVLLRPGRQMRPPGAQAVIPVVAREYVSVQRDYILFPEKSVKGAAPEVKAVCAANEKLNGVLFLNILEVAEQSGRVELEVGATLEDCREPHGVVWKGIARNRYDSADPDLKTVIESYGNRLGKDVLPYAAPAYLLVRALLEELPNPRLTEDEKLEKIEVME